MCKSQNSVKYFLQKEVTLIGNSNNTTIHWLPHSYYLKGKNSKFMPV